MIEWRNQFANQWSEQSDSWDARQGRESEQVSSFHWSESEEVEIVKMMPVSCNYCNRFCTRELENTTTWICAYICDLPMCECKAYVDLWLQGKW